VRIIWLNRSQIYWTKSPILYPLVKEMQSLLQLQYSYTGLVDVRYFPQESRTKNINFQNWLSRVQTKYSLSKEIFQISEQGASERRRKQVSVVGMKAVSRNPSEDLPNQERNPYWTVYCWENGLYIQNKRRDQIRRIGSRKCRTSEKKARSETVGMKTQQAVQNNLHYMEGRLVIVGQDSGHIFA